MARFVPRSGTWKFLAISVGCVVLCMGAMLTYAQDRDLSAPHDVSNGIDCNSCHVPFGGAPNPTPPGWISNSVCRSCHNGTQASEMSPHLAGGGATVAWCTDCHNPHQHQPDYPHDYIRDPVRTPNSGSRALSWRFDGDFLHGATGVDRPYDGICETCHTQTAYHRNTAGGNHTHNATQSCTSCHRHQSGFQGACDSCHGAPPATGAHVAHFSLGASAASYGATAVDNLSTPTGYAFACGTCHPYDENLHNNGTVDVELASALAQPGTMKSRSPLTATYVPGGTLHSDANGITYTEGSCSNVYCHSGQTVSSPGPVGPPLLGNDGLPLVDARGNLRYDYYPLSTSTAYSSISWGDANPGCTGCHGNTPRTSAPDVMAGTGDTHSWIDEGGWEWLHAWNMGFSPISCRTCHYGTVTSAPTVTRDAMYVAQYPSLPIDNKSMHVNGVRDVIFDPVNLQNYRRNSYSLASTSWDPQTRTCSTVPCHLNQTQPEWGKPYRGEGWGSVECDQCHHYSGYWATRDTRTEHPLVESQSCGECHLDPHNSNR